MVKDTILESAPPGVVDGSSGVFVDMSPFGVVVISTASIIFNSIASFSSNSQFVNFMDFGKDKEISLHIFSVGET